MNCDIEDRDWPFLSLTKERLPPWLCLLLPPLIATLEEGEKGKFMFNFAYAIDFAPILSPETWRRMRFKLFSGLFEYVMTKDNLTTLEIWSWMGRELISLIEQETKREGVGDVGE